MVMQYPTVLQARHSIVFITTSSKLLRLPTFGHHFSLVIGFKAFCLSDATDIGGCFGRLSFHKLPYQQGTAFLVGVACLCPSSLIIAGAAASHTPNLVCFLGWGCLSLSFKPYYCRCRSLTYSQPCVLTRLLNNGSFHFISIIPI